MFSGFTMCTILVSMLTFSIAETDGNVISFAGIWYIIPWGFLLLSFYCCLVPFDLDSECKIQVCLEGFRSLMLLALFIHHHVLPESCLPKPSNGGWKAIETASSPLQGRATLGTNAGFVVVDIGLYWWQSFGIPGSPAPVACFVHFVIQTWYQIKLLYKPTLLFTRTMLNPNGKTHCSVTAWENISDLELLALFWPKKKKKAWGHFFRTLSPGFHATCKMHYMALSTFSHCFYKDLELLVLGRGKIKEYRDKGEERKDRGWVWYIYRKIGSGELCFFHSFCCHKKEWGGKK